MFQNMSWKTLSCYQQSLNRPLIQVILCLKKNPSKLKFHTQNLTSAIWTKKHCNLSNLRQKTSIETEDFNWDRRLGQFVLRWIGHQLLGPKFEQCQAFVCASCFSDLDMFFSIIFGNQGRSHSRWMACLSSVNKYDMIHWYRYPYEKKIYHNQKKSNICF